jgi:hypothetical protein
VVPPKSRRSGRAPQAQKTTDTKVTTIDNSTASPTKYGGSSVVSSEFSTM